MTVHTRTIDMLDHVMQTNNTTHDMSSERVTTCDTVRVFIPEK